jgi:hypothetical protein
VEFCHEDHVISEQDVLQSQDLILKAKRDMQILESLVDSVKICWNDLNQCFSETCEKSVEDVKTRTLRETILRAFELYEQIEKDLNTKLIVFDSFQKYLTKIVEFQDGFSSQVHMFLPYARHRGAKAIQVYLSAFALNPFFPSSPEFLLVCDLIQLTIEMF